MKSKPLPIPKVEQRANPKSVQRLAIALALVGLFGGPCAMQGVFPPERHLPTEAEYASMIEKSGLTASDEADREQLKAFAGASRDFFQEKLAVQKRFRAPSLVFNLLLCIAYCVVFLMGMRASRFLPDAARNLSIAALCVLPARVAVAAVDLAMATSLRPAIATLSDRIAPYSMVPGASEAGGLPLDQLGEAIGRTLSSAYIGVQAIWTILVLILFHWGWRYFGAERVRSLYPEREEDDER